MIKNRKPVRFLLCAATPFEVLPIQQWLEKNFDKVAENAYEKGRYRIDIFIYGVGPVPTAIHLTRHFENTRYDWALSVGVGGSFREDWTLGTVYAIRSEQLADWGAEDHTGDLLSVFDLGLVSADETPFINGKIYNPEVDKMHFIGQANGLTVGQAHGSAASIERIRKKFDVDIESMEGAVFEWLCTLYKIPRLQLRALSNYVEPRNRENWKLQEAITQLGKVAIEMLQTFTNDNS